MKIFCTSHTIIKNVLSKTSALVKENKLLSLGFVFGLIALLINATYIDVFEASKVAYTFWTVAGLFIGYSTLSSKIKNQSAKTS